MEREPVSASEIIQAYFNEPHRQHRVADLEQRLLSKGYVQPEAAQQAFMAYRTYFKKVASRKGLLVGFFMLLAITFLYRVISISGQIGNFMQISAFLAITATLLTLGVIWGMQLFQLKEEISSFRDLRRL
ncbi:MAG TPA: hypothetical protein VM802_00805 [Chitinophaga sp.]|uniref:hypothetical protein n=1 Tax=Chitinophaga sp. TaxID=1869181 RepID=UPI002C4F973B|nr:hypothetical protein [Chitinophaga sp.]HVI43370.1 hypothetical protein [Chitinophaga sp.]